MKQTYVTALLLWLMLAGVCRGQGQNRFGVIVAAQTKTSGSLSPLWLIGTGVGISYQLPISKKISFKAATIAILQNEHVTCNDTTVIFPIVGLTNNDTILACTDASEKRLWQLQIPVMVHYSPNPLARVPLVIGAGVQVNVLLSSIDQSNNYFEHKGLRWVTPLSIGTCIKLPNNKRLSPELLFCKQLFGQQYNRSLTTYALRVAFEF